MAKFGRIATAMVTPFDQRGKIDFERTTQLIEHLIANGTDTLVISGTTGESPTLSRTEKISLFKHTVEVVAKRIPIIAGTGSNNTADSIALSQEAEEIGVDALLLVVPYYNRPNQEGLYQHFRKIAESVKLPIMLYNVPGRTAQSLSPKTVIRLAEIDNVVAVKEASGDLGAMTEIIAGTAENFELYSGDDGLTLPTLAIGGVGIVSVASHLIGNEMQTMIQAFNRQQHEEAAKIHQQLLPLMKALFIAPSPAPLKAALNLKNIQVGSVRLPLVPITKEELFRLKQVL